MHAPFKRVRKVYPMLVALCVACFLILPISAGAMITSVEVEPSNPTVNDSVVIRISGGFSDGCWEPGPGHCESVMGSVISPWIYAIDWAEPGDICIQIWVPYSFECNYGRLPAGHYVVDFTEWHQSMRDPMPEVLSVEFDVTLQLEIEATVDFDPNTLNFRSKGKYATCYIELTGGYDPEDIDVHTVQFEYAVDAVSSPTYVGDQDSDGIPDRMIKFPRDEVIAHLSGQKAQNALKPAMALRASTIGQFEDLEVTISGELTDGTVFVGTDAIRVANPGGGEDDPLGLEAWPTAVGGETTISYELAESGHVSILVYDATGRRVRTLLTEHKTAGSHDVVWNGMTDDGLKAAPGVYFARSCMEGQTKTCRMVLVR